MNDQRIIRAIKQAENLCGYSKIHLIKPEQVKIECAGEYLFGIPASLPVVTCIAESRFGKPYRDMNHFYSVLGLVWFQSNYAFPIEAKILKEIKLIPFSKLCLDCTD